MEIQEMETMAAPRKKKTTGKRSSQRGRPKGEQPPRRTVASFKASEAFETWFADLVKHLRIPASSAIEKGLILLAEKEGYDEPAPKR